MTPPDPLDAFEQRLAATPPREPPPELRARILANARAATRDPWTRRLAALLWPHPLAWGALAAGWLAIAALHLSGPRGPELYAVTPPEYRDRLPSAEEYFARWEIERRLLARLAAESALPSAQCVSPLPRSPGHTPKTYDPSPPPLWKRLLRFTIFSGALLVTLLALGLSWFSLVSRREWAKTKADLLARGEKLSVVELAPPPVPDEQNFFADPIWRPSEALPGRPAIKETPFQLLDSRLTAEELAAIRAVFPNARLSGSPSRSSAAYQLRWGLADLPPRTRPSGVALIERLLAPLAPVPPKIESLLARGDARFPFDYATLLWKTDPYPGFHPIGQTLASFASAALFRGDSATAAQLTQDLLRMSDTLAKDPSLYAQMLRIGMVAQGRALVQTGLEEHLWDDDALAALQNALAQIDLLPGLALAYRGERGRSNQAFEAILLPSKQHADLVGQFPAGLRRAYSIYFPLFGFDDRVALNRGVQKILDALEAAPRDGLDSRSYRYVPKPLNQVTRVFANSFFHLLGGQVDVVAVHMTDIRQTLVACALERYRLRYGTYPATLADLVPAYLPAIPRGILVLEPLHYRRLSPATFRLWAAGHSPEADIVWPN